MNRFALAHGTIIFPCIERGMYPLTRRRFIRLATQAGIAAGTAGATGWSVEKEANGMIYRTLGRTGEGVSAIGLGGFHIGNPVLESTSIRLVRSAIDRGITFMDNCWDCRQRQCRFKRPGQFWTATGLRNLCAPADAKQNNHWEGLWT